MVQVKVKDAALREAAMQDMDAFLAVFVNATKEAIGGELNAENMQQLSVSQITLLAYDILHEEVMDGGFVQLIYNGYGGFIFDNPFAKVLRDWGLRDLAKMLFAVRKLYKEHGAKICRECDDEDLWRCLSNILTSTTMTTSLWRTRRLGRLPWLSTWTTTLTILSLLKSKQER